MSWYFCFHFLVSRWCQLHLLLTHSCCSLANHFLLFLLRSSEILHTDTHTGRHTAVWVHTSWPQQWHHFLLFTKSRCPNAKHSLEIPSGPGRHTCCWCHHCQSQQEMMGYSLRLPGRMSECHCFVEYPHRCLHGFWGVVEVSEVVLPLFPVFH